MNKLLLHASPVQGLSVIQPMISNSYKHIGPVVFASSILKFAACFGTRWSDKDANISVIHTEDSDQPKVGNVTDVIFNMNQNVNISLPCSMYMIRGDFDYLEYTGNIEEYSKHACKVINERTFVSMRQMLEFYGVKINKY